MPGRSPPTNLNKKKIPPPPKKNTASYPPHLLPREWKKKKYINRLRDPSLEKSTELRNFRKVRRVNYSVNFKSVGTPLQFSGSSGQISPFHKTLPRSCLQMHLISVRFYEMGDIIIPLTLNPKPPNPS